MENATQALLIAAGILFGILTLSALVYMFNSVADMQQNDDLLKEEARLSEWNAEWEAYNKRYLYGAEVLTVLNKAEQNNKEYDNNELYEIKVEIIEEGTKIADKKEYLQAKKTAIFTCEKMEYNGESGRVQKIVFKFVE